MKINSMFRVLIFSVTLMTFSMSFPTFAQVKSLRQVVQDAKRHAEADVQLTGLQRQAVQEAKRHAEADAPQCLWFTTGLIGGFFGYLVAYTYHPPVPALPLLGKSPEYVAAYTDTYRKTSQKRQSRPALFGCVIGIVVGSLFIINFDDILDEF